jgi:glycolate oxidase iron-sulfur subunit
MAFDQIDSETLNDCVACGLCLPHCPTYRATGQDLFSPRGRIALIGAVKAGHLEVDAEVSDSLGTCIQCLACVPACPSGVDYEAIITPAVVEMAQRRRTRARLTRAILWPLTHPRVLRAVSVLGWLAQTLHVIPKRLNVGRIPLRRRALTIRTPTTENESVVLYRGCVMDAWYRDVHHATVNVLSHLGYNVEFTGSDTPCCGALHQHAGLHDQADSLGVRSRQALTGRTVVVNSAGCGAMLKSSLSGLANVYDIHEFVHQHIEKLRPSLRPVDRDVIVQDPCHLRHVQRAHEPVHQLLGLAYRVHTIPDDGLCCGAGGLFSTSQPGMARAVRDLKTAAISGLVASASLEDPLLASANPGCIGFLAGASDLSVMHPIVLLDQAIAPTHIDGKVQ